MLEALTGLFDVTGFSPRKECGTSWTPSLMWLHMGSDLFIWLAYVSIPLVLLYFTRRRDLPFPRLFVLFALFILACGTTHLTDALTFEYPVYRFAGLMKLVTAVVSWVTVVALIPVIPRVMWAVSEVNQKGADTRLHRPLPVGRPAQTRWRDYIVAILAGVLAILVRTAIDPLLTTDQGFVVALLAVVYVSWQYGFGPGIVCLVIGVSGYAYFFMPPRYSFVVEGLGSLLALALFFFCGVGCAALGESQRAAQRRARRALSISVNRQEELESEVARRRVVEAALRQREAELVTAQRQTAEALARLNAFLDNAPLGIAFFDSDLRYVRVNPYFAAANGKPVSEHIGRPLAEVLPDFPPEMIEAYRQIAGPNGTPFTAQVRRPDRQAPDQTRIWQVTAFPVRQADGHTLGAGVVAKDVTDRLRAEEHLRWSEERFRTLTEAVPQMVWTADPKGVVRFVNRRWEEFTGKPLDEGIPADWGSELIDPEDAERVRARWQLALLRPTDGFSEEFRLRRASDGQYRWMLSVAIPRRDNTGAVMEWVGTLTDIDDQKRQTQTLERMVRERTAELEETNSALTTEIEERKAIEEQLREVATELVRSNEELEKFAYIASHDLQEPLRKIQAFGDRLRDKCREQLPDLGREYVDRMLAAASRMRRLIDDLLSFSRVTTQKKPFHPVDLDKLVRDVVSDLDVRIGQSGGTVDVQPLPRIDADPTQMRQLFQNLIANAVKFQRPGVPPVVEIASELVEPSLNGDDAGEPVAMCRISVRDNGIGFNEKYRDRIFEMFQRLHRRDEYEGTGVGLAICRKIVERHGGTITAQSREGHGATFVVTLPVRQPNVHEATEVDVHSEQTDHDSDSG